MPIYLSYVEFKLIAAICSLWRIFEKITEMLSVETYSTINMACVFRSELASLLEEDNSEIYELAELKQNMKEKFDLKFPISELISVGVLLHPRCQNLLDVNLLKKWTKERVPESRLTAKIRDKNLNYVEELVEKQSNLNFVQHTMRTEGDVDREIYFLLSLAGNFEIKNI